jgi:hypothetical protein
LAVQTVRKGDHRGKPETAYRLATRPVGSMRRKRPWGERPPCPSYRVPP